MERYNPLEVKIRMVSIPKVKALKYWQTLLRAAETGADLPRGWDVEIQWRNPMTRSGVTKRWRADAFSDAINESRSGFIEAVREICLEKIAYHERMTRWKRRQKTRK